MTQEKGNLLLVKTYYYCTRILEKISSFSKVLHKPFEFINACHCGFWLGILKKEDFHLLNKFVSDKSKMWTEETYNKSGLHKWEKEIIGKYFQKAKRLVVIAAGGGREILALYKLGYEVDGFECDPKLVEFADNLLKKENVGAKIEFVARDHGPNNNKIYNGAIIGWGAYMLVCGKKHRISLLKELRAQLPQGAPILLSFFTRPEKTMFLNYLIIIIANTIRSLLQKEGLEIGDNIDRNYRHRFIEQEIAEELKNGKFELIHYGEKGYGHAIGIAY